jgi:hypothetical protein
MGVAAALSATLAASAVRASWMDLPLKQVVQQSHVVVIGEITGITAADPPAQEDRYAFDIAHITVEDVLLNTLTNRVIQPGQELPLSMPSAGNSVRISTDIRYRAGMKGIWILELKDETFWATYPKDFQPMSAEKDVRQIVKELEKEPSSQAGGSDKK